MDRITSRQNPLVRRFREVAAAPLSSGLVLLDGAHLLQEALHSQVPIEMVAVADEPHAVLARDAEHAGARLLQVSDQVLAAMSPARAPSGIVALARCRPATLAECLERAPALVLVLAGVQDPGNVGAIIRTAEACGATGVICSDGTADPFGWKALRGAMGSTLRLRVAVSQPLATIEPALIAAGVARIAAVPRDGTPLRAFDFRRPVAILLGAEGAGLPPAAATSAEARITIPMRPPVESLNVSIAAALVLYEAAQQRECG